METIKDDKCISPNQGTTLSETVNNTLNNVYDTAYNHAIDRAIVEVRLGDLDRISLMNRVDVVVARLEKLKKPNT